MNKIEDTVLGIDIGGSHITAALVDVSEKKLINKSYQRFSVNSWGTSEAVIDAWVDAIKSVYASAGISNSRIGIALPGPFDYENGISYIKGNNKYESLYGLNVKDMLAQRLDIEPENIRMLNDAAGFLQGEAFAGVGKNYDRCAGITLGTGLGTSVCIEGRANDANLWNSKFKNSIAEDYISTRWFVRRYFELTGINIMDVRALNEIVEQSVSAKVVFKEFAENLSEFLVGFLRDFDSQIVIIAGNITKAAPQFLPSVIKILSKSNIHIPIKVSLLGEKAALIGAASCWQNKTELKY